MAFAAALLFAAPRELRAQTTVNPEPPPPSELVSPLLGASIWTASQFVPSPLLIVGDHQFGGGMRWQVTPLLYSFGVSARPFRTLRVAPIARHSGSIELHASPEWACCAPGDASSWLLRIGPRLYLPLLERGERLSWSLGASYYFASGPDGVAADVGIYTLSGLVGLNVTVSPWLGRREVVSALTIRFF